MRRIGFLFVLILISINCVFAQKPRHVIWECQVKSTSGNEAELLFKARIEDKWDLYSQFTGGTMPMFFSIDESKNFKVVGDFVELTKTKKKYEPVFKDTTVFWEHEANFKQKIKLLKEKETRLTGRIEYQICNVGVCVPEDFEFEIMLPPLSKDHGSTGNNTLTTNSPDMAGNSNPDSITNDSLQEILSDDSVLAGTALSDSGEILVADNSGTQPMQADYAGDNLWLFFIIAFGSGLLAVITQGDFLWYFNYIYLYCYWDIDCYFIRT
ncbi:MAG: hypothetical protein HY738_10395 [Bacteroidia bacterium]|nr:hypothetical protein [Bacteroidia bacterium]